MKPRTAAFTFTDGEGGSGYSDRLHTFLPLTWCFRISVHHRLPSQVLRLRHHQRPYRQADLFVVTVTEATLVAATAIALAVVSDALSWAELYSRLAP
jgi:hypothetical protein